MKIIQSNRGFSLVELLIGIVVASIILAAVTISYTGGLKIFKDVKSISDNIETKTPSIELISRYFDRWGVGVVSKKENLRCLNCPTRQKEIVIANGTGAGSGCSDVTFYGNLYGYGVVTSKSGNTANVLSCRLSTGSNQNCYTLWRNNSPLNDPQTGANANLVLYQLPTISAENADCSTLPAGTNSNMTMNHSLLVGGNPARTVEVGDMIQRSAHRIRLYCNNLGDQKWLYVDLTDYYGGCAENENASPIAPVDSFTVTAIPENPLPSNTTCSATSGGTGCGAVQVTVTFRSHSSKYAGGSQDTYTVSKIFGRVRQERD